MFYGKHKTDGSSGFFMNQSDCHEAVEISQEEWKKLLSAQSVGKMIKPNEMGYPVSVDPVDTRTYAQKRRAEYPDIADFLDAQVKLASTNADLQAEGQAQLATYVACCLAVKAKYPKD